MIPSTHSTKKCGIRRMTRAVIPRTGMPQRRFCGSYSS